MRMRTFAAVLLALLLTTACLPALAVQYNAANVYTIQYDDTLWLLDDLSYRADSTDEYHWLFIMYREEGDVLVDAALEVIPEFEGLTLCLADAQARSQYLAATLDAFADQEIRYVDTILAGEMQLPFYVYEMIDENGPFLYAETISEGCAIHFHASHTQTDSTADTLLPALEELLITLEPVLPE